MSTRTSRRRRAAAVSLSAAVVMGVSLPSSAVAVEQNDNTASALSASTTVEVVSRDAAEDDAARLKTALVGATDLQPTGLYLPPDTELTIEVDAPASDPNGVPSVAVGAPGTQEDPDADEDAGFDEQVLDERETELQRGANTISDEHGGVVYLSYPNDQPGTASTAQVTFGAAAQEMPTFELGETDPAEYQRQLDQNAVPFGELISEHTILTFEREELLKYRNQDQDNLMRTLDRIVEIEQEVAGYSDEAGPESAPPAGPHHLVGYPGEIDGVGAYATDGFTAYPPPIQSTLLTVPGLTLDGWGPYHELGHQYQQQPVNPPELVEVTVNIFSLAVQREFERIHGQEPRLRVINEEGTSHWDDATRALDGGIDDFADLEPFEQVAAFDQLRLRYGQEVYTEWMTIVRQQDLSTEEADQWHNVIVTTSLAAGEDLGDFWETWGVEVPEDTREALRRLGLPDPTVDPSSLRETNVGEAYDIVEM